VPGPRNRCLAPPERVRPRLAGRAGSPVWPPGSRHLPWSTGHRAGAALAAARAVGRERRAGGAPTSQKHRIWSPKWASVHFSRTTAAVRGRTDSACACAPAPGGRCSLRAGTRGVRGWAP